MIKLFPAFKSHRARQHGFSLCGLKSWGLAIEELEGQGLSREQVSIVSLQFASLAGLVGEFNKQTPQMGFVAACGAKAEMGPMRDLMVAGRI